MRSDILLALMAGILLLAAMPTRAEPLIWGVQVEELEYRNDGDAEVGAWDLDAFIGGDDLKFVWRSEAEYTFGKDAFETFENQARIQIPVSDFFDAVAGIRLDTPFGPEREDRVYGVIGLHGLTRQWFEIDADLFVGNASAARFEVEYEGLITNRLTVVPSIEFELPFEDDREIGIGAWGPKLEAGIRVSYDLIDRTVSPYVGLHYERVFGESADLARDEDENVDAFFFVMGVRLMY